MTPEEEKTWMKLIERRSWSTSNNFPDVPREEVYQELWLFVLENPSLDPDTPGVTKILNRQAFKVAWQMRKQHLYQTSQYSYRTDDVRSILETVFDYEDWEGSFVPDDAKSLKGGDAVEMRADISAALDRIPESWKAAIISRYRDQLIPGVGTSSRQTLNRAIRELTDTLNFYRKQQPVGGPGTRESVSNEFAAALLRYQEER